MTAGSCYTNSRRRNTRSSCRSKQTKQRNKKESLAAVYTEEGKKQTQEQIAYYMNNAKVIRDGLASQGYTVSGGVNAPYIWLKTPEKMTSWDFFDYLLQEANVVGTPGSGFGPSGEGYFRLTAFGSYENTVEAIERIKRL